MILYQESLYRKFDIDSDKELSIKKITNSERLLQKLQQFKERVKNYDICIKKTGHLCLNIQQHLQPV